MEITLNLSFAELFLLLILTFVCCLFIVFLFFCCYQIVENITTKRKQRRLQQETEAMEQEYREHLKKMSDSQLRILYGALKNFSTHYTIRQKQMVEEEIKKRNV